MSEKHGLAYVLSLALSPSHMLKANQKPMVFDLNDS